MRKANRGDRAVEEPDVPAPLGDLAHLAAERTANKKQTPTAAMPISEPLRGMRLPKKRIATNDAAISAGMRNTQ